MKAIKSVVWISVILCSALSPCYAEGNDLIKIIQPEPKKELWINAGMYSYHFARDSGLNNNNVGFGAEYSFSSVASLTIGGFKNSDSAHSNYGGIYYHPVSIGWLKLGFVAGAMSGYPSTNNGGYFPALIPTISAEGKWVGANVFLIPSIGDKVHSAISFQLKLKVYD